MAHVVFGLSSDSGSYTGGQYNALQEGLIYWNESMPRLRDDLNPDSLIASGNYIGWVKDTKVFNLPPTCTLAALSFFVYL